jgi:transcriptional antiterminator
METYNLKKLELITIKTCIKNNSGSSQDEIAKLLGISVRTLQRKIKKIGIIWNPNESNAIQFLQSIGYSITKNDINEKI